MVRINTEGSVVKRILEDTRDEPVVYISTKSQVKKWFDIINKEIFDSELEYFHRVFLEADHDKYWGWVIPSSGHVDKYDIHLMKKLPSEQHFVKLLAHEMVHLYDYTISKDDDKHPHGRSFSKWKYRFSKFGIKLSSIIT
jgi:hypothetical protein